MGRVASTKDSPVGELLQMPGVGRIRWMNQIRILIQMMMMMMMSSLSSVVPL
jgi:hypothetical protein